MDRAGGAKLRVTTTSRAYRLFLLHPIRLLKKLLAEHASPRSLGAAAALGVLVGASPFFGLHTFLVYVLASRLRLNRLLALGTNQLCMPPFVPALCIEAGYYLRHGEFLTEISLRTLGREALERFWEWLLGALVLGPVLALLAGGGVWLLAVLLQRRGVGEACASNPLGPPLAKGESMDVVAGGVGLSGADTSGESEKATPAGQP